MKKITPETIVTMLKPREAETTLPWNSNIRIIFEDVTCLCREVGDSCTVAEMMDKLQVDEIEPYEDQLPELERLGYVTIEESIRQTLRETCAEMYLDWFNNFLTHEVFAGYYGISVTFAKSLIAEGKRIHENNVENMKKEKSA